MRRALCAVPAAACLLLCSAQPGWAASLQLVDEFGGTGQGPGQFSFVVDLEVAPNGNLVVSDAGNGRIQVFTPNGTFVRAFGSSGSGPGQFFMPAGVAVRDDGSIFVHDAGNGRVHVFSPAGAFVRQFPVPGLAYADMAFDPAGASVYLVDYQGGNIQRVSITGADMGASGGTGTGNGQFARPQGIAVDETGDLYVADRDNNRVQKLNPSGLFLAKFGSVGSAQGQMRGPLDVAIGAGGNVLVADNGNDRLQEFTQAGRFVESYDRIAGSPTPAFRATVVTAAPSGDIYLYDNRLERIVRVRAGPSTPTLGENVNVAALNGTVRVDLPGGGGFVPLGQARQVPVGSVLDTKRGKVKLTSARDRRGRTQTGQFGGGVFKVRQGRSSGGLTELALQGGSFGRCRGGAKAGPAAKGGPAVRGSEQLIRKLSASAAKNGKFRTRGRYSASTVRGTVWDTIDRCDGTLTRVRKGSVVVRDLRRGRTVVVRAGNSYLAKAPGG